MLAPNKFINRAISFLFPIECPDDVDTTSDNSLVSPTEASTDENDQFSDDGGNNEDANMTDLPMNPSARPTLKASIEARQKLR